MIANILKTRNKLLYPSGTISFSFARYNRSEILFCFTAHGNKTSKMSLSLIASWKALLIKRFSEPLPDFVRMLRICLSFPNTKICYVQNGVSKNNSQLKKLIKSVPVQLNIDRKHDLWLQHCLKQPNYNFDNRFGFMTLLNTKFSHLINFLSKKC